MTARSKCSASLLLLSLLPLAAARDGEVQEAFLTHPDIHGNRVVFTAEGDLWLADIATGSAWRLTSDPGVETNAHFSPDGSLIAYTASYDGGNDVYVIPASGGVPKRLTYDCSDPNLPGAVALGWTPDGRNVLFGSGAKLIAPKFEQERTQLLYTVRATGGVPIQLPVPRGAFASINRDGHRLAYVPTSSLWMNWFQYKGGEADRVWLADMRTGKFTQLTNSKDVDTEPVWVGDQIYFVSSRSGSSNLWRLDPSTKASAQVTFYKDVPVRFPSTDGSRIVYQVGPSVGVYDPATGKSRTLPIHLNSDRVHLRPYEHPVWSNDHSRFPSSLSSLSPDGKRVVLAPRGHLVTVATQDGATHLLVNDSSQRIRNPIWSPDGKGIAYVSDASGEEQIYTIADEAGAVPRRLSSGLTGLHGRPVWSPDNKYLLIGDRLGQIQLVDANSGSIRTIARDKAALSGYLLEQDFSFSPDGKWIAYASSLGWRLKCVSLYEIATGKTILASDPAIDSAGPVFSSNGKYLFMQQDRAISQSWTGISGRMSQKYETKVTGICLSAKTRLPSVGIEVKGTDTVVDAEGLVARSFDVGLPAGDYAGLWIGQGRLFIQSGSGILVRNLLTEKTSTLLAGGHLVDVTPDGKKLLAEDAVGPRVVEGDGGPVDEQAGRLHLDGLTVTVIPQQEWRQMFQETWRVWRDLFYDPNMHGFDWNAVRRKYLSELSLVGCREDLKLLVTDMISELQTSHSFAGAWPDFIGKPARPGVLGADYAWDTSARAYRITKILRGDAWDPDRRSPLAEPGLDVREGDYLLRIAGTPLRQDEDPAALLLGTAGREIDVTVNRLPTLEGARTIAIKTLTGDGDLRLKEWIAGRRAYVEKASGGQIAYVCLSDMGGSGATLYAQQYYPNVLKPAMLFDIRGNDGGNISGNVMSDLFSRPSAYFAYRDGSNYWRENWAPSGHLALVTNEWAFSDADYFSDCFKRFKFGPVVGHRTTGGVVSPVIYTMVDGSGVGVPNAAAWADGEWSVEGKGAVPDFEVDQDPAAVMAGRDPQLDRAISLLLEQLRIHPLHVPMHPPYRVKQ